MLKTADRLDETGAWMDVCAEQIGYLMGRNPYGRSMVTGIGIDPPVHPHHRPSTADSLLAPWPGLLIGGPQQYGDVWLDWQDSEDDYWTNETAINWNAALVYAFAGFLGDDTGTPDEDAGDEETLDSDGVECVPDSDTDTVETDTSADDTEDRDTSLQVVNTPIDNTDSAAGDTGGPADDTGSPMDDAGPRDGDSATETADAGESTNPTGNSSGCGCRLVADRVAVGGRRFVTVALLLLFQYP